MEVISVPVLNELHGKHNCSITYTSHRPIEVSISSPHFGTLTETGDSLFDALAKLRLQLEKSGWLLLCNVARRDAYPSQMMIQMALCRKIYLLKCGMPARRDDIVDIFGEAHPEQVGTVQEQSEYHSKWIKSLGSVE
ncbi:hypothetical protein RY831_12315 [Noviherbaspirillum sp. CPCC 100848]|uniref:Uncharacterized protein n=1 Tax=Noviherbaspirillum album TaxID=3080276 RepID=A0ABU6J9I0_9BURK|nr:hypothetical protein [Noviherbaspirillum sp. CPCC 100848]MEC4719937.1 hypothetical protein [Noviherbaspirillum sp. CPCC 100848]